MELIRDKLMLQVSSCLVETMAKAMEDMTNSTHHKFKQKSSSPTPQSLFLFVSSIARTNLEVELVQRGGSLCSCPSSSASTSSSPSTGENAPVPLTPKRSCIGNYVILFKFIENIL
jgi:hypothetical protein